MVSQKQIVLITGANTGIGYLAAEELAAVAPEYHTVIGSRSEEKGRKAVEYAQRNIPNGSFSTVQLDVTDRKSIETAAAQIKKEYGRLDVLINNAGKITAIPDLLENLRDIFETNTFGQAIVTEAFLPLLLESPNSRLIYVSSDLGSITNRTDTSIWYSNVPAMTYRMSKAALNMLAACQYMEFRNKGLKVWSYNPGYVVTDLSRTGEAGLEERRKNGAGDPRDSAKGLVNIVLGKRDADVGKFVFEGGVHPW